MKRKFLLHLYALQGGGAERVVASLATGLAARGHAVTLATDFDAPEAAGLVSPDVRRLDLGRSHAGAVLRLARHIRAERPDATLSATGVSNLKHAAAAILAGRRRRAVLTFHGHVRAELGLVSALGNGLSFALTRLTGRSVFVSDELRESFARLGASPARSVRIYNPVPVGGSAEDAPATDAPATDASGERAPREAAEVLGVGRLVPLKGFDTLLRAFARLGRADAHLTILGEGPARAGLERDIRALGLVGRVSMPGWVDDPSSVYARASCLAVASRRESFGNVVVEALAHGLPVVATDCGGPAEILGGLGRIVPVGDADAMTAALAAALADPGDPEPRRARAAAFAPERALDAYEALLEEVIAAAA